MMFKYCVAVKYDADKDCLCSSISKYFISKHQGLLLHALSGHGHFCKELVLRHNDCSTLS